MVSVNFDNEVLDKNYFGGMSIKDVWLWVRGGSDISDGPYKTYEFCMETSQTSLMDSLLLYYRNYIVQVSIVSRKLNSLMVSPFPTVSFIIV